MELPSQLFPAAHVVHIVREVDVPPVVKELRGHTEHLPAFAAEYVVSKPHGVHLLEPPALYWPAPH